MSIELPDRLVAFLRERKALLWICQRAELAPGSEFHDESTSLEDAVSLYRSEPNQEDLGMAKVFWEACWTESIVDLFYDATSKLANSEAQNDQFPYRRLPYPLATDPDSEGQIDRRRFLPIYEVNGTDRVDDPEGQYGGSRARRLAYKLSLIRRLEDFPGRAVVVVGALDSSDLESVRIAADFIPPNNLVVILWPPHLPVPDDLETLSRLDVHFLRGTRPELIRALVSVGAPQHSAVPRLGIHYRRTTLDLREEDLFGVDQDFVLIQSKDFELATSSDDDLDIIERLWRSEPDDWTPFANEMVFRRHYQPVSGLNNDLSGYVISKLRELTESDRVINLTLTIPATSGSGITTALRHTAFVAARSGFPTLLCKPANQKFSVEKLGAFLNRLQERGREQSFGVEDTPALIIFDRQHRGIEQVSELATALAARGRRVLVVEVIPPGGEDGYGPSPRRPKGRHTLAREFRGDVDEKELRSLSEHFSKVYEPLQIPIPNFADWLAYQRKHSIQSLNEERSTESLFWIALRFFVGEGNPHFDVATWVGRTFREQVKEPSAMQAVRFIAAFSSFGIAVPLVPLLRSVGMTRTLDTSIMPTLRRLSESEDLLQWGDSEEHLHDQTVSLKHRLIAIHLLEELGACGWEDRLRECWLLLEKLQASPLADSWLVETLVFEALRVERFDAAMRDRLPTLLETLEHIPPAIAERSASTQHHWARALGLKARHSEDATETITLYFQAVKKLESACELAESERGREHPRNIYNSLGVMRSEFSRALRGYGQIEQAEEMWQSAAVAFDLALRFGSDNFVVLSAYAYRLIEHAREIDDMPQALGDIASALSYLAQAEEAALLADSLSDDDANFIEVQRNYAWNTFDSEQAEHHIEGLISKGSEIGFVLRAYEMLRDISEEEWKQGTASQLRCTYEFLSESFAGQIQNRSWRSVFLMYRIVSALRAKRFDFRLRLSLLDELDALPFRWYSGLRFAQSVLCYQTGDFRRGFNLFRDLRSRFRSGDLQPMRLTSFWREPTRPSEPRQASVRIRRVHSDWVAYGEVPEMNGQQVLARPRWFEVQPKTGDVRPCHIVFEVYGPLAVPTSRHPVSLID
ncbi:MAG: hypothetical protein OXF54_06035 [Caldilineaceae bacterium]|nr:hypothetical protein [Caldilineaceae bacterium]